MSYLQDSLDQLERPEYREDSERIVKVCFNHGVTISLKQAENAWILYSDSMAAGWMRLPENDEELWRVLS